MNYTQDQETALVNMMKWVNNGVRTDLLYTLDGAAGTGKTTIVKEFLNLLNLPSSKIAVTAPTHQAKKVIREATGYATHTIQKLLGLRPDVNMEYFDINKPVFAQLSNDSMQHYKYILIDESSMINSDAFELIKKLAIKYGVRVVFIGDSYQLPPIREYRSKVFTQVLNKSTLTTVVRQNHTNPMARFLPMLREDVKTSSDKGLKAMLSESSNIVGNEGFACMPSTEFSQKLLEMYLSSEYQHDKNHVRLLSYTNDRVEEWSTALRSKILGIDSEEILNIGENLIGYTSVTDKQSNLILENGETYIVEDIQNGTSSFGVPGFYVKLLSVSYETSKVLFIVDHRDLTLFKEQAWTKLSNARAKRGSYWSTYINFKKEHYLLKDVLFDESQPKRGNNLICNKDLFYGYSSTVHKSQGSTYNNTGINLHDIYKNWKIEERSRLIYVAFSRARSMNLILGK